MNKNQVIIKQKYNIVVVINERYLRHMFVMLFSLFQNNALSDFQVYIFASTSMLSVSGQIQDFFSRCQQKYHLITICNSFLDTAPILDDGMSKEAYYKLLIPLRLPREIKKVLYLDSDIIIQGSITNLWNSDLEGKAFGAVKDYFMDQDIQYKMKLMSLSDSYINTGVLLIDLEKLREIYQFDAITNYINKNGRHFRFHDQEVINGLFYKEVKVLDEKYNYICSYRGLWDPLIYRIKERLADVCIFHYALSGNKPWNPRYRGKYGSLYWKYARKAGFEREYFDYLRQRIICFPVRMWELFQYHYKIHFGPWIKIKMKRWKSG